MRLRECPNKPMDDNGVSVEDYEEGLEENLEVLVSVPMTPWCASRRKRKPDLSASC